MRKAALALDASSYRKVERVEISQASDIKGRYDGVGDSIAPGRKLRPDITPARLTSFPDLNDNKELNRFTMGRPTTGTISTKNGKHGADSGP